MRCALVHEIKPTDDLNRLLDNSDALLLACQPSPSLVVNLSEYQNIDKSRPTFILWGRRSSSRLKRPVNTETNRLAGRYRGRRRNGFRGTWSRRRVMPLRWSRR